MLAMVVGCAVFLTKANFSNHASMRNVISPASTRA